MKKIMEFYENMNEIVYVSDMETYEVVYMNRKARELHGIRSLHEIKGKKCYEVLQGSSWPCAICNNPNLKKGYFEEWRYFNPAVGKPFMLKDTLIEVRGRKCRIELAIDLSQQEEQDQLLQEYMNNEAIINEALKISLSMPSADKSIETLLEYVGKALRCERIYIFEEKDEKIFNNTYEWCAKDVTPQKDNLQNIPIKDMEMWMQWFRNNKNVIIEGLENLKESDPVIYEYLYPQDIHTLVASPLFFENKIIGFCGVDNPPGKNLENISTLFMIMGHFIVSLLKRRDLIKRLENLSYYDQMTGFGNRYAMNEAIINMDPKKSVGIVNCDVTGLKYVNDTEGHQAGDALLLRACQSLREVYSDYALFRIGGDEFLVLCAGIAQDELAEREKRLRETMKKHSVLMAVGCVWRPRRTEEEDMNKLFAEADERMYEDKRKYYTEKSHDRGNHDRRSRQ